MGASKYSVITPKKAAKKRAAGSSASKKVKKMILKGNDELFDFENPLNNITRDYPIDGIEYIELNQTPTSENPYNLRFDLPPKATYLINHTTKFFVDFTLQQQKKKADGTWEDKWSPADLTSEPDLVFYDGFIRKKFKTSFFRNDLEIKLNQNFDSVNTALECWLWAHLEPNQREAIGGNNRYDSSKLCLLKKSDYTLTNADYQKFIKPMFEALPMTASFCPIMDLPFPNRVDKDGLGLKNFVLLNYEDTVSSIRLSIKKNDTACFYQSARTATSKRFRLKVNKVKLFVGKIRYRTHGYNLSVKQLMGLSPKKTLHCPTFIYDSYIQTCNGGDTFLQKTFKIHPPSKLLIFKANTAMITGSSQEYSTANINGWMDPMVTKSAVTVNSLKVYDESFNVFNAYDKFAHYFNIASLKRNFLNGFQFNRSLNMELFTSADYNYPSLFYDFLVSYENNARITPVLGYPNQLESKCNIDIRLDFDNEEIVPKGIFVFIFMYEDKFYEFDLKEGILRNPLLSVQDGECL